MTTMRMPLLAALAALTLTAPLGAQQSDRPPDTPGEPVAVAYGRTAGEVRWQRSSDDGGAVPGYEITRDGIVLGVHDTLSVVERGLEPNTTYTYGITAIDNVGQRSNTASIELTTRGMSLPQGPDAPSDLEAAVYSRTAAELFWARSPSVGIRYEIARDGVTVETTDGTSLFDESLASDTTYTYDIVAIDRQGQRSSTTSIVLTTRGDNTTGQPVGNENPFSGADPDGNTLLARLGYPVALELADDLVSTRYLTLYYAIDQALIGLLRDGSFGSDVETACPGGGSARGEVSLFLQDITLDDCRIDGHTLSGKLRSEAQFIVFGTGDRQEVILTFDDLTIDAGVQGRLQLSGTSTRNDSHAASGIAPCGEASHAVQAVDNRIEKAIVEHDGVVTTISNARWQQSDETVPNPVGDPGDWSCTMVEVLSVNGTARVDSTQFGANGATFEKSIDITRDPRDDIALEGSARLVADFGDGSSVDVTAAPRVGVAEDDNARIDIVAEGVAVSFSDDHRFEASKDFPTILGQ